MNLADNHQLTTLLEELAHLHGVRGALIATAEGAFFHGEHAHFERSSANDIAKTVRRMVVASATVGAPLEELLINFGPARMMIVPVREEATLAIMLERDTATATVRALIRGYLQTISQLFDESSEDASDLHLSSSFASEHEDEVDALMAGELGPVLQEIQTRFIHYAEKLGQSYLQAQATMREQAREWLLCCNPSPYTFPLLLDGLAQTISAEAERQMFIHDVQQILQNAKIWAASKARK